MKATYHFNSISELTSDVIESIKMSFNSKPFTIIVEDEDELSSEQKSILDQRLEESTEDYLTDKQSIEQLKKSNAWFSIEVSPRAQKEIQHALDYYALYSKPTADKFILELTKAYKAIASNPYFEVRYKNIRSLKIYKFPYSLYFIVD